jgi:hypothetical protein
MPDVPVAPTLAARLRRQPRGPRVGPAPRLAGLVLALASTTPAVAADSAFALSGTTPAAGFELVDRGVMVMRGGPMERREVFETWRAPSGERWQRSIVTPADGSYRVEGEWRSDATGLCRPCAGAARSPPRRSRSRSRRGPGSRR